MKKMAYVPHKYIKVRIGKIALEGYTDEDFVIIDFDDEIIVALDKESLGHLKKGLTEAGIKLVN